MDSTSSHDKKRKNVQGDRLSNLRDDLIHKILSFIGTKRSIQTSVLSSRWRYIWTSMPSLDFSTDEFDKSFQFSRFVINVLFRRNNEIQVSSVKLAFRGKVSKVLVKEILDYAFSHNVQQLNITLLHESTVKFPQSLFRSQALKHLTLTGSDYKPAIITPPDWELPALTTLNLHRVKWYDDSSVTGMIINCANLKNLTLKDCRMVGGLNGFNICHPGLSSLTLEDGCDNVNVVTPQLNILTINNRRGIHVISAPNLSSLRYKHHDDVLKLSSDFLHLERVDICISVPSDDKEYVHEIVSLLQQLHSTKFLTLNSEIIEILSSSMELISHLPSPFTNLKGLKIYPFNVTPKEQTQSEVTRCIEVKNYLLDGSPGATFTMVSREEIRALMNVASAQKLMTKLQMVLHRLKRKSETDATDMVQDKSPMTLHTATRHEQVVLHRLKRKSITDTTDIEQDKAPMESGIATGHGLVEVENHRAQPDTNMKWRFGERMAHIKCYWEDVNKQLEKGNRDTLYIISTVQRIEEVLTRLPTSHHDKLQAQFSRLCAEADTVMDNMMDRLKIRCDKKPIRSNVYLHELATSSHPSS